MLDIKTQILIHNYFSPHICCECGNPAERMRLEKFYCANCFQGVNRDLDNPRFSCYHPRSYRCYADEPLCRDADLIKNMLLTTLKESFFHE